MNEATRIALDEVALRDRIARCIKTARPCIPQGVSADRLSWLFFDLFGFDADPSNQDQWERIADIKPGEHRTWGTTSVSRLRSWLAHDKPEFNHFVSTRTDANKPKPEQPKQVACQFIPGMTIRDWFAGQVLSSRWMSGHFAVALEQVMEMSRTGEIEVPEDSDDRIEYLTSLAMHIVAEGVYQFSDAMMKLREETAS